MSCPALQMLGKQLGLAQTELRQGRPVVPVRDTRPTVGQGAKARAANVPVVCSTKLWRGGGSPYTRGRSD
uniref:Uncharacterized protein n=1 Tax=Hyaloperonospora arabidopsidis (strain Emoy2) TaxID=559515 RepID=M4C2I8_HYAAE